MRVYFDYNATTPLAPEVIEAVARMREPTLRDFGDKWVEFPVLVSDFGRKE